MSSKARLKILKSLKEKQYKELEVRRPPSKEYYNIIKRIEQIQEAEQTLNLKIYKESLNKQQEIKWKQ